MTAREKTKEINNLASIADRKGRVVERLVKELMEAQAEHDEAVGIWRLAIEDAGPRKPLAFLGEDEDDGETAA